MKALLFPGQGSQIVGMGLDLYNNYSLVKKIFSEADERQGFKIAKRRGNKTTTRPLEFHPV